MCGSRNIANSIITEFTFLTFRQTILKAEVASEGGKRLIDERDLMYQTAKAHADKLEYVCTLLAFVIVYAFWG